MKDDYRYLFEANPHPMLIYEVESLRILAVNDTLCSSYGYLRDELIGASLLKLTPDDNLDRTRSVLARVQSGNVRGFNRVVRGLQNKRKDGTVLEIECVGQPVEFEGRHARLILLSDIGQQRRAEHIAARLRALLEHARDLVLFLSTDGRILDANGAATRAYGYPREQLLTLRISDLREPTTVGEIRTQLEGANEGSLIFHTLHRRRDGSTFPVEVQSTSINLEGERILLSVIRDCSADQQRRAEMYALAARLERADAAEVRRIAASLRELAER